MKTERNRLCMLDQLFFMSIVFHQLRGWALGKGIEKETLPLLPFPLSQSFLSVCGRQRLLPILAKKGRWWEPMIIQRFGLFLFLFFYCIVVFQSILSSSQRRLCLLFLNLFCHPAKDDFACCSYISFFIQPKTTACCN